MNAPTDAIKAFHDAREELRGLGISLAVIPGEYRVSVTGDTTTAPYLTDDLADAIEQGRAMAAAVPFKQPPLGPLGKGRKGGRRARMYRHNRRIAAERRKGEQ